jgi:ATP-dependent DNA helicase RecQ
VPRSAAGTQLAKHSLRAPHQPLAVPPRPARSSAVSHATLKRLLRERFGLDGFRPGQEEVIRNVLRGVDTLAVMPTGAGKSLCYQLPGLFLPGTTVVVSPLIALMNDQADKLDRQGVDTARVNSTLTRSDESQTLDRIAEQASEMVFVTPERLQTAEVLERLARNPIDIFVIDEAHCISQWGHDFRPAFLEIAYALHALGDPPVLALTATATEEVVEDIRAQLGRSEMALINASVYRPNLHYCVTQVSSEQEKNAALERVLMEVRGTRIVYTATVKAAEAVHERLSRVGHPALLYHGRMRTQDRRESQERFMGQADSVMVATNAFGLGIDKPDVRAVVHYQMPASLEAYYQESGRAGRDGGGARCELLFDSSDRRIQTFFLAGRYPSAEDIEQVWRALLQSSPAGAMPTAAQLASLASDLAATKARVALKALQDAGLVRAHHGRYAALAPELDAAAASSVADAYRQRAEVDRNKLEQLVAYAYSARCRWVMLMEYFGEVPQWEQCGTCDNCRHPPSVTPVEQERAGAAAPVQPKRGPVLELGQRVSVPRYGSGTVTAIAGDAITIAFPDGKRLPFMRGFVTPSIGDDCA